MSQPGSPKQNLESRTAFPPISPRALSAAQNQTGEVDIQRSSPKSKMSAVRLTESPRLSASVPRGASQSPSVSRQGSVPIAAAFLESAPRSPKIDHGLQESLSSLSRPMNEAGMQALSPKTAEHSFTSVAPESVRAVFATSPSSARATAGGFDAAASVASGVSSSAAEDVPMQDFVMKSPKSAPKSPRIASMEPSASAALRSPPKSPIKKLASPPKSPKPTALPAPDSSSSSNSQEQQHNVIDVDSMSNQMGAPIPAVEAAAPKQKTSAHEDIVNKVLARLNMPTCKFLPTHLAVSVTLKACVNLLK
jgi:hypothetical protein